MAIHLKIYNNNCYYSIRFYGITQDPETHSYMMVLKYAKDGNLREYLKINLIILIGNKNYIIYLNYLKD
jgi:hypothetical protein